MSAEHARLRAPGGQPQNGFIAGNRKADRIRQNVPPRRRRILATDMVEVNLPGYPGHTKGQSHAPRPHTIWHCNKGTIGEGSAARQDDYHAKTAIRDLQPSVFAQPQRVCSGRGGRHNCAFPTLPDLQQARSNLAVERHWIIAAR